MVSLFQPVTLPAQDTPISATTILFPDESQALADSCRRRRRGLTDQVSSPELTQQWTPGTQL